MLSRNQMLSVLMLEGLASSGLQIIAIRQSVPFVGSSILSTSIILSVFLGALAAGYMYGGRVAAAKYSLVLSRNLLICMPLFGVGMSYIFHEVFYNLLADLTDGRPFISSPLLHVSIFSLLILAPLVFLLAQTVPLLLNSSPKKRHSEAAGDATAFSTIGNVIGCLLTSLVLMHYFGVAASIVFNCLVLSACLLIVMGGTDRQFKKSITVPFVFLCVIYVCNISLGNAYFEYENAFSNTRVISDQHGRNLVVNRSYASYMGNDGTTTHDYIEIIRNGIVGRGDNKDLLVLGSGGFTLTRDEDPFHSITYIDIDPDLVKVAEEKLIKRAIAGTFYAEDARRYLIRTDRKWDFIVVDVYSNSISVPTHISTGDFYALVASKLTATGTAVINMLLDPLLKDDYSRNVDYTIRSSFDGCVTDIVDLAAPVSNVVYFCSPKSKKELIVYRDDSTLIDIDRYFSVVAQ